MIGSPITLVIDVRSKLKDAPLYDTMLIIKYLRGVFMENVLLIYNIIMTVILTVSFTGFFLLYRKDGRTKYLYAAILFVLLLIDNLVVYLSEFSSSFSDLYESSDFIYVFIYGVLIGVFIVSRFLLCEMLEDKIRKIEYFVFLLVVIVHVILNFILQFEMTEMLIYTSFYLGIAYLAIRILWIRRTEANTTGILNKTIGLLMLVVLLICIGGIIESVLYYATYNEVAAVDEALMLDYRYIAFDILKFIACIVSIKALDKGFGDIFRQGSSASKTAAEKVDAFCAEYVLTNRQKEIITLILEGDSNKDISDKLCITEGTVKTHVYNIFQKTEVTSRNQIVSKVMKY